MSDVKKITQLPLIDHFTETSYMPIVVDGATHRIQPGVIAAAGGGAGTTGSAGTSGTDGTSGTSGTSGTAGSNGTSGTSGLGQGITDFQVISGSPQFIKSNEVRFVNNGDGINSIQTYDAGETMVVMTIKTPDTIATGGSFSAGLANTDGSWLHYLDYVVIDGSIAGAFYATVDGSPVFVCSINGFAQFGDTFSIQVDQETVKYYRNGERLGTHQVGLSLYKLKCIAGSVVEPFSLSAISLYATGLRGLDGAVIIGADGSSGTSGTSGYAANYSISAADYANHIGNNWYYNFEANPGDYSFSAGNIVTVTNITTSLHMVGTVNSYVDAGGGVYQIAISEISADDGFPGAGGIHSITLSGLPGLPGPSGTSGLDGTSGTSGYSNYYATGTAATLTPSDYTIGDEIVLTDVANMSYTPGQMLGLTYSADNALSIKGIVSSYIDPNLSITVTTPNSYNQPLQNWRINLAGADGLAGSSGTSGTDGTSGTSANLPYSVYTALLAQSDLDTTSYSEESQDDPFIIGLTYYISSYSDGDDFTNVGAPSNASGVSFVATGQYAATWNNGSTVGYNKAAPTVTVLENTIGNIWFTYDSVGSYSIRSTDLFTADKTYITFSNSNNGDVEGAPVIISMLRQNVNTISLQSAAGGTFADNVLPNMPIEIRVYN